jgi:hypothetical protein
MSSKYINIFTNQHKIYDFLVPNMIYFKKKSFYILAAPFHLLDLEADLRKIPLKYRK